MKTFFNKIFGTESQKELKRLKPLVQKINILEETYEKMSDDELRAQTQLFKEQLAEGKTEDDILPEAFAVIRETAKRVLGMRHYDVQLIGGMVLNAGKVAEMRTGEGKTLSATLPVYLNSLSGKGVHVVTVNDYLARRDAQWMGQVYAFHGLTVSVVNDRTSYIYDAAHDQNKEDDEARDESGSFKVFYEFLKPCSRSEAYAADITYGTNNQFGFDYLRDNTARSKQGLVQKEHNFVIIDEVDSILIDEARVPLILSSQAADAEDVYRKFAQIAQQMKPEEDFSLDEKLKAIEMTDAGIEKAEKLLGIDNLFTAENVKLVHHLETAVRAKAHYIKDREYVIQNKEVVIVDPFTGRTQQGRRWSDGLHQAIEAKENMPIKAESKTMASITYQNYFKMYNKLSGMTGTGASSEEEFQKVYGLDVVVIPTHRPIARKDKRDLIYQTEDAKFKAVAAKAKELQEKGQPLLIGTVSVEKNEMLSLFMAQAGVKHTTLNAKNHEREGEIIADAGRPGAVTIATNMAGRGVDIKLGGANATKEEEEKIKELGGLYVIGTERHESRRVDDQLRGRSGRQGDPGETRFYISLDDPLMRIFGSDRIKSIVTTLGLDPDEAIEHNMITKQIEAAQKKIEGFHFDARKHVLAYDDVLSHHRNLVYERRKNVLFEKEGSLQEWEEKVVASLEGEQKEKFVSNKEGVGDHVFNQIFNQIYLSISDRLWMQHLDVMGRTRQSVNLRAYGQREPLVEYKKESLRLFQELEDALVKDLGNVMVHLDVEAINKAKDDKAKAAV